jgi:malonate transporter and related proteins
MLITSFSVLLPVFFVMALGYWAGRTKRFDADQTRGLNDLVMTFALPSLMFVATVTTTRSEIISESFLLIALLIAFLGLFIAVTLFSMSVLRHDIGAAGLQAFLITFPSVAFFGIPIFKGLFGEGSLLSITSATVLGNVTIVPLAVVLLEIHAQHSMRSEAKTLGAVIWRGIANSLSKPMVWAPLLGALFVLLNIDSPNEIDAMLSLVGSTTGGASLFLAGLIIASYSIKINRDVLLNICGKMILQPALMALLVFLLAIPNPLGREGILMCAIPASAVAPILAARYQVYEVESASTVVLDSLLMVVTFTIIVLITGG